MGLSQQNEPMEMTLEDINASVDEYCESITALKKKALNKLIQEKIQCLHTVNNDLYSMIGTVSESLKGLNLVTPSSDDPFVTRNLEEFESKLGLPVPGKFTDQETMDLIAKYKVVTSIFRNVVGAADCIHGAIKNINRNSKKD